MPISHETRAQTVEREDLVMFINACFACTAQREFYSPSGSRVGLDFLHRYILGNYRRVYARTLAAGINHFNQAEVIFQLLASGAPANLADRKEEGELVSAALARLPAQRAYRLLTRLREMRVNNRRSRAVVKRFLASRHNLDFELVKYRQKACGAIKHAHVAMAAERARLLFGAWDGPPFAQPLFEACRQARYSQKAVYQLPFTIAEGFAAYHQIPRERFLIEIEPRMTDHEKLRMRRSARDDGVEVEVDFARASLTKLATYLLALSPAQREQERSKLEAALDARASTLARGGRRLGRVAAVLDNSYSSSGSTEKRRRPLAVALAVSRLLRLSSVDYLPFWTTPCADELTLHAEGQSDLARPLLRALATQPDLIVIVSDGVANAPAGGVEEVVRLCRERLSLEVPIVHLNPAFEGESIAPRGFGRDVATVGIRDAESFFVALAFARFALGAATLTELEVHLDLHVAALLGKDASHAQDL